jgi:hypothetical protein
MDGKNKNQNIDNIIDESNWMESKLFEESFKSETFSKKIEDEFTFDYNNQNQIKIIQKKREQIPSFAVPNNIDPLDIELNEKREKIKDISTQKLYNFLNNIYIFNTVNKISTIDDVKSKYQINLKKVINMYSGDVVNIVYENWPISVMKYQKTIEKISTDFNNEIIELYPLEKLTNQNLLGKKNDVNQFHQFCNKKINGYFIELMREKNGTQKKAYKRRK